jgi:hypothetical protein
MLIFTVAGICGPDLGIDVATGFDEVRFRYFDLL